MTAPALAAALRAHAQGLLCSEAAAELLIAQSWLYREDFTSQFVRLHPGTAGGQQAATIDWPAVVTALGASLPCSGGEQRMLRITASLDQRNLDLLVTAIRHACGQRPAAGAP